MKIVLDKLTELSNDLVDATWVDNETRPRLKQEIDLLTLKVKLEGVHPQVRKKLNELYQRGDTDRRMERLQSYIGEILDYLR